MLSTIAALIGWGLWFIGLARAAQWSPRSIRSGPLVLAPLGCAAGLLMVLMTVASQDVVNDPLYILMYLVMGMGWVGMAHRFAPLAGLSYRFDVLERANPAAGIALAGYLAGTTACFAGGNIGDGPGWWVVVFCAGLATATLMLAWITLGVLGGAAESVTIERDVASGLRLAGLLLGGGLILGRAVAGDWHSLDATIRDFGLVGWPIVPLTFGAILIEMVYRPTAWRRDNAVIAGGVIPALGYVCAGAGYVYLMGIPQ